MMKAPTQVTKVQNQKKKVKKNVLKSCLDNPFSLSWPSLNFKLYSEVVSALRESLAQFRDEGNGGQVHTGHPKTNNKVCVCDPFMVFGFNGVMRGIEKEKIGCVLVNADAKPDMLLKCFIPVCDLKAIPLIPVKSLSDMVRKAVGVRSTLALGVMRSACEGEGRCRALYGRCCQAVGLDPHLQSPIDSKVAEDSKSKKNLENGAHLNAKQKPPGNPSEQAHLEPVTKDDIKACHLKRENSSERVFKPPKSCLFVGKNILSASSSFIGIRESKTSSKPSAREESNPFGGKQEKKSSAEIMECTFFIDDAGDRGDPKFEEATPTLATGSSKRKKEGKGTLVDYIPAKIKRIKANKNRRKT